jgi:tRNA dimethylallyltransferase
LTRAHPIIHILCGPTASGKSVLALAMARDKGGIVINADSMQIYDALPILSARPTAQEMGDIPHHLYGIMKHDTRCSAQLWRDKAVSAIERALDSGATPILVGGTGLYIKALMEGLSDIPDVPPDIRDRAILMQRDLGNPGFHSALAVRDPLMAAKLNPNDTQRLIRAWEVLEATGKSLCYWQSLPPQGPPEDWRFAITVLRPNRALLHARIDRRFDQMMAIGALDEVRAAMEVLKDSDPIANALGYRPLCAYLRGETDLKDAIAQTKAQTRQYAKRQDTWFRHQIPTESAKLADFTILP